MNQGCADFRRLEQLNRRTLLRAGGLSWFGLSLDRMLAAREAAQAQGAGFGRAKSCILLFMWGGPAHQDTWDLKPDAPVEIRGDFRPIATNVPGIQICEHFPLLAPRGRLYAPPMDECSSSALATPFRKFSPEALAGLRKKC